MKIYLFVLASILFVGCNQDVGFSYGEKDGVYFQVAPQSSSDTLQISEVIFSFGMVPDSIIQDTAKIVVNLMGNRFDADRFYKVAVKQDSTSAREGEHYTAFAGLHQFGAGLFKDTLRVLVNREHLSSSHIVKEQKRLMIELQPSDDFNVGINQGRFLKLTINNFLDEPKWWKTYTHSGIGYYHPEKWKILMGFHADFKKVGEEQPLNVNVVSKYFSSLRNYLDNIPTFDKETNQRVLMDRLVN
ncbi:MAG: DUF4843 domain-containing protein [Sphingobacterium sp.]|jgi:hypothetical protein|nr:DUF4843 domain-containing protein [Sphingobacterium sp.]